MFIHRRPVPHEGRLAIVTDAGRDAVDAEVPITNGASKARFLSTSVVVVFGFDTTFNRISYSTCGHDRYESHPLLLILA
jgi:hypothetical protein